MIKKVADFIVNKRYAVLLFMVAITVLSVIMMPRVKINSDMAKYLPDSSPMKQGLDIMNEAFPEMEEHQSVRVMFDNLTAEQKVDILEELGKIPNVDSISYDEGKNYNRENHTLYVINSNYDYDSAEMRDIENELDRIVKDYDAVWESNGLKFTGIPPLALTIALSLMMVILFAMSGSWFEPFLFLAVIGIAVLINTGSNVLLSSVSNITASIAAILQLVLSMDYSIILINRYRQEKEKEANNVAAMKVALKNAFSSIASSSLTTVVGLLMLSFMSFKIGMDLGVVLAKGVFISMVCVLTILPCFILMSDKLIAKTSKKVLSIRMKHIASFEHKARFLLGAAFIVFFGVVVWLQNRTEIAYSVQKKDAITEVFPTDNMIVMVYENADEAVVAELSDELVTQPGVKAVNGYSATLGRKMTAAELAGAFSGMGGDMAMEPEFMNILFYSYYQGDTQVTMTFGEFLDFLMNQASQNPSFAGQMDSQMMESLGKMSQFMDVQALTTRLQPAQLAATLGMDEASVTQIVMMYQMQDPTAEGMSVEEFAGFMLGNEMLRASLDQETIQQFGLMQTVIAIMKENKSYTAAEMAGVLAGFGATIDADTMGLLYTYYGSGKYADPTATMSVEELVNYLAEQITAEAGMAQFIGEEQRDMILAMQSTLAAGKEQLVAEKYSRVIIDTELPEESEATTKLIEAIDRYSDKMSGDYYLIGNSAMAYEMKKSFDKELILITLLTAAAIFLIIAFSFKSLFIPLLLVLLVQGGVYSTVSVIGLRGSNIHYLALLIVECILMGATIDYGILFSSYYRENRKKYDVRETLQHAYDGATHTILTSGLILTIVTAIAGNFFGDPTAAEIVATISLGAFSATVLILFILPGLLAVCDRLITGKKK